VQQEPRVLGARRQVLGLAATPDHADCGPWA
jgi:hypothetical protein